MTLMLMVTGAVEGRPGGLVWKGGHGHFPSCFAHEPLKGEDMGPGWPPLKSTALSHKGQMVE